MGKVKEWYTLEKNNNRWTIWHYREAIYEGHGGYGSLGIYTSDKKEDCLNYCDKNGIKIKYRRKKK